MTKKIYNYLFVAILSLFMFGCVVKQEVYFNRDFSGNYKYSFDFTEYINYMGEGEEGSDSLTMKNEDFEEYLNFVKTSLNEIDGITNLKIVNDADNGVVYFTYNFANVDALNAAMKYSTLMETEPAQGAPFFQLKKKTLTYIRHAIPQEEPVEGEEDTSYMNDMFSWEFTIGFEGEMKKFDVQKDTSVTISNGNRTFVESGNVFDVTAKESKWVFKTK